MASIAHEFPELRKDGGEVIEATLHLIDEEMKIAERLERKAGEQWQFVALMVPLAIGGALTAAGVKGLAVGWIVLLVFTALVTIVLLVWSMFAGSTMAYVARVEGLDPEKLDAYIAAMSQDQGEQAEAQVRASLARDLVDVARSREAANEARRQQLDIVLVRARITFLASVSLLVLAAIGVMVNA